MSFIPPESSIETTHCKTCGKVLFVREYSDRRCYHQTTFSPEYQYILSGRYLCKDCIKDVARAKILM